MYSYVRFLPVHGGYKGDHNKLGMYVVTSRTTIK